MNLERNIIMNGKEIYRCRAIMPKSDRRIFFELMGVVLMCFVLFHIGNALPYGWFLQIGTLLLSAILINKTLRQGTFIKTYVLYEDTLVVLTRYGLIEKETARYPLSEARFSKQAVEYQGKTYPFYPDDKLKKLLKKNHLS